MPDHVPRDRRPIASRGLTWVKIVAAWLVRRRVSPNAISIASIVFAVAGAWAMIRSAHVDASVHARLLWGAAAACVQLRLLANLFDGMVAIAAGRASATGELFNEVPDRISDTVLLVALGFVPGSSPHLGYGAALLAMFCAYLRTTGAAVGAGQVFSGVMAKPQRMFVVTLTCVFLAVAPASWVSAAAVAGIGPAGLCLVVIGAGCIVTAATRLRTIRRVLRSGGRP